MRKIININNEWVFTKNHVEVPATLPTDWENVNVPHCWNNVDGQDGGNDYYRSTCYYAKEINLADLEKADEYYIEIQGANSSATLYLNGEELCVHHGGYSTWRVNLTKHLKENNLLVIAVNNEENNYVYPQRADFTFYGGLYRDVNIVCVNHTHFDLDYYGGCGVQITPEIKGKDANINVKTYVTNQNNAVVRYNIYDKENNLIVSHDSTDNDVNLAINDVVLWHGRKNPYLYTLEASLVVDGNVIDTVKQRFGCRTFAIDPEKGFILNGEEYPLRGVSRHQDRWGYGNALLKEHHIEDMDLICEVGATTIRLAHYQHDQFFYDLCDERGMVVWAEIPYISNHMATGRENTITQMKELVTQNYNHASIVVWGLSNEITMISDTDPDLIENHHILNNLCHEMDKTRLTTMAMVSMCPEDSPMTHLSDVVSYNHYFGWYGGNTDMNGPWFDDFHKKYPNRCIGVSEYGCEALNWHTSDPKAGDYTEEYQSFYHEELIKQLFSRKYLWATHVWNMFDFGADARSEGGENGQNHKGLVTFDRKYKKDSFYAYKAWLSSDPFVHICSKRYIDRVENVTKVTVYSNLPEVELFINGKSIGKKVSPEHFFYFDVENVGESNILAVAGDYQDESVIRKVDTPNEDYILREKGSIINWFEITSPAGRYSILDSIDDLMKKFRSKLIFMMFAMKLFKQMKGKKKKNDSEKSGTIEINMKKNPGMMKMLGGFSIYRLSGMIGMAGVTLTKEQLLKVNKKLNRVKKPKNNK